MSHHVSKAYDMATEESGASTQTNASATSSSNMKSTISPSKHSNQSTPESKMQEELNNEPLFNNGMEDIGVEVHESSGFVHVEKLRPARKDDHGGYIAESDIRNMHAKDHMKLKEINPLLDSKVLMKVMDKDITLPDKIIPLNDITVNKESVISPNNVLADVSQKAKIEKSVEGKKVIDAENCLPASNAPKKNLEEIFEKKTPHEHLHENTKFIVASAETTEKAVTDEKTRNFFNEDTESKAIPVKITALDDSASVEKSDLLALLNKPVTKESDVLPLVKKGETDNKAALKKEQKKDINIDVLHDSTHDNTIISNNVTIGKESGDVPATSEVEVVSIKDTFDEIQNEFLLENTMHKPEHLDTTISESGEKIYKVIDRVDDNLAISGDSDISASVKSEDESTTVIEENEPIFQEKNTTEKSSIEEMKSVISVNNRSVSALRFEYEFGGPIGATFTMLSLPLIVIGLYYLCNENFCVDKSYIFSVFHKKSFGNLQKPQFPERMSDILTVQSMGMFVLWIVFQFILERFLPAQVIEGTVLSTGNRLKYRINGHLAFWVTLLLLAVNYLSIGRYRLNQFFTDLSLSILYDRYVELAAASCIFSVILSIFLYAHSFRGGKLLANPGMSGNFLYDFFLGRELNPRPAGDKCTFDLKFFCELRPGLIGWVILNLGMLSKQIGKHGSPSLAMLMVVFGQGMYVWDALYFERSVLTTMDVTSDGFGFMLAFGDLAWVPFIYSLQARYLVDHSPALPAWYYICILMLHFAGYMLFRGSNCQKDAFRRDPLSQEVSHLKYIQTKRGTKLLVSGYWGVARKINYTGDWLMSLSWCLCCGFNSPIPYFYITYFTILLVHRAIRDDHACALKYGDDWKTYKKMVPYMFIPKFI